MFQNFKLEFVDTSGATLRVRHGGSGPPVLLLHGHPRTHTTWHRVAPLLARDFTVVCPDLRGFGQSSKPADTPDHSGSSQRAKALDCVELMQALGHRQFSLVGHDRGAYTAFRAAMDHPQIITKLAVLDGVPIGEALQRANAKFAQAWWHWFFFGQLDKPERAILADPGPSTAIPPNNASRWAPRTTPITSRPFTTPPPFTACWKITAPAWASTASTTRPTARLDRKSSVPRWCCGH